MKYTQEISIFNPLSVAKSILQLGSRIDVVAGKIESEVTARTNADDVISSRITQLPHTISLAVSGTASKSSGASITLTVLDEDGKQISESSGTIKIDGNVIFSNELYNAGTTQISGSRITGGTLKLGGANNGNGQLYVYNASGTEIGHWNNNGIYIRDGEIYQEKYVDANVKNAWLRIKSTEITGGYTGLGHTATVDLQDWQWVTDTGASSRHREGTLNLKCSKGSIALTPDNYVFIQAGKECNMLSNAGSVIGYPKGTLKEAVSVASGGIAFYDAGGGGIRVVTSSGTYKGQTQMGCHFAPDGDGVDRWVDIVDGIICNLRYHR